MRTAAAMDVRLAVHGARAGAGQEEGEHTQGGWGEERVGLVRNRGREGGADGRRDRLVYEATSRKEMNESGSKNAQGHGRKIMQTGQNKW